MNRTTRGTLGLLAVAVTLGATSVSAQQRDQDRTRTPTLERSQQLDRDQSLDRDRAFDRDRDRDQDRDAADRDRQQDRDRDATHLKDQDRLRDRDIYGSALMSATERDQYRDGLRAATSDREWAQVRAAHQEQMQARARERGIDLDPPLYGQYLLTAREQARYGNQVRTARTEQAKIQLRQEHQEMVRTRARELGVDLQAPVYGQQLMTEREQAQYRERLQAATSAQERERLQNGAHSADAGTCPPASNPARCARQFLIALGPISSAASRTDSALAGNGGERARRAPGGVRHAQIRR